MLLSVCSCRSSKTDTTIHQDNTEQKQTEQEEVSKDKAQVDVNKNVERIIEMMQQMEFNWQKTNYSPPDNGKQYPTSTETATGTSTKQEKETYNEQSYRCKYKKFRKPCCTLKEQLEKQGEGMIQRSLKRSRTFSVGKAAIAAFFYCICIFYL